HKLKQKNNTIKKVIDISCRDSMTGLYNRMSFEKMVQDSLDKSGINNTFIMVDIDEFKGINDIFGHLAGDKVIITIADIIKNNFRSCDFICRMGGDEFAVFIANNLPKNITESKMKSLIDNFKDDLDIYGNKIPVKISVGVLVNEQEIKDFKQLYTLADSTLYMAKHSGKNKFIIKEI
ncbi:MAG: GGDEF domain-containing protein, partial [Oscillospiraceae bacterium]